MQVRQTREAVNKFVSEAFAEILLVPIRTHIQKRQDGYRGHSSFSDYPGPPLAIMYAHIPQDFLHLLNEAVTALRDGLNVARVAGVVAQDLPQLHDAVG